MFMEHAAELGQDQVIHSSSVVRNALEEINLRLAEGSGAARRQASLIPVEIVKSLEAVVMDKQEVAYVRGYAWYKLVKVWGCARFSDTTGMPAKDARWDTDGFSAWIRRSKTTGPGKKVWTMKINVTKEAWLEQPNWLWTGWLIWQEMGRAADIEKRDYFLPKANPELTGVVARMATCSDVMQASQMIFNLLRSRRRVSEGELQGRSSRSTRRELP